MSSTGGVDLKLEVVTLPVADVDRAKSFFGKGLVAHVSMAHPVCGRIGDALIAAGAEAGMALRRGGRCNAVSGDGAGQRREVRGLAYRGSRTGEDRGDLVSSAGTEGVEEALVEVELVGSSLLF